MANINKIRLSGTTYNIEDSNATKTVELSQAEYNAIVASGGVESNTFYIISDGEYFDPSDYYTTAQTHSAITQATSGKVDSSSVVTAVTSGSTDSEIPTAKAVFDAIPTGGTGGGKTISAGTNISVTTGETADTVNCTLPIYFNSNNIKGDIAIGTNLTGASSSYHNLLIGRRIEIGNESTSNKNIGIGFNTDSNTSTTYRNTIYGANNVGIGANFEIGTSSYDRNNSCIVIGSKAKSKIDMGVAIGANAVASGTTKTNINNQLKIDTSNQVYIYNKDNTEMICLQDQLGGGGASYSAGTGIDITNNVISVSGVVETSAITTAITSSSTDAQVPSAKAVNDKLGGLSIVKLTQAQYDALATKDSNTLYVIVN